MTATLNATCLEAVMEAYADSSIPFIALFKAGLHLFTKTAVAGSIRTFFKSALVAPCWPVGGTWVKGGFTCNILTPCFMLF